MNLVSKIGRLVFLLFVLIQSSLLKGQEKDFVYGQLVNSDEPTPIPFAHITVKNKAKGTISNMDGGFRVPKKYYKSRDTLVISSIGYSSRIIPLISFDQNQRNVFILERKEEVLDEITIREGQNIYNYNSARKELGAEDIVQLAIDQIPENYPHHPFSYVGYYRDYQLKKGN